MELLAVVLVLNYFLQAVMIPMNKCPLVSMSLSDVILVLSLKLTKSLRPLVRCNRKISDSSFDLLRIRGHVNNFLKGRKKCQLCKPCKK